MSERTNENKKLIYLLVCIVSAFCLWVYVSYVENPDMTRWIKNVPVTISGEAKLNENGFAVQEVSSTKIDIKVRAKRNLFGDLSPETIKATADVSSVNKTGENTITATVSFPASSNITITDTSKMDIKVLIDEFASESFAVEPFISKELPGDYYINSVNLNGGEMLLSASGCKSEIDKIHHISTSNVDLSQTTEDELLSLSFIAVDDSSKEISNVKLSLEKADVFFEIYKQTSIPLTLEVTGDDPELIYQLSQSSVRIFGPAKQIDELSHIRIGSVNEFYYKNGSSASFNVPLPQGISLAEGEEGKVEVSFSKLQ